MKKKSYIECDNCKDVYLFTDLDVKEEKLINGRVGMYFNCPTCGVKYPFVGISRKGVKLQKRLKQLRKNIKNCKSEQKYNQIVSEYGVVLKAYQNEVTGPYNEEEVI